MSTESGGQEERRAKTQEMVEKWLAERQEMLVLFCQLAGLEPFTPDKSTKRLLKDFCQVLVDYMAFGHFEVYDRISRGEERRNDVRQVAEQVYPLILEATEISVAFNDKYDASDHELTFDKLHDDLSALGEELAIRIEMEDRLVAVLKG